MDVRDMIRKLMLDKGVTYAELEKRTGLSASMLNRYVTGKTKKIPIENLELIAKALNVPPVSFFVAGYEIKAPEGRTYIDPEAAINREIHDGKYVPDKEAKEFKKTLEETNTSIIEALTRLSDLYKEGLLTAEEFRLAKEKLLK